MIFQVYIESMLQHNFTDFENLQKCFGLPTALYTNNGIGTQVTIGLNYFSTTYVDNYFFYCTLSVAVPSTCFKHQHKSIVGYFIFGQHKIAIPLRHGDIIISNPLIPHCATNALLPDTIIYSIYVSNCTVATFITECELNSM